MRFTIDAGSLKKALAASIKTSAKNTNYLNKIELRISKGNLYIISTNMYMLGIYRLDAELKTKKDSAHALSISNVEVLKTWLDGKMKVTFSVSKQDGKTVLTVKEKGTNSYCELSDIKLDFPDVSKFLECADGQPFENELVPAEIRALQGSVIKKALSVFGGRGAILELLQPEKEKGVNKPIYIKQGTALVVVMPVKMQEN